MRSERSHRIALLISGTIGLVAFSFVIIEHLKIRSFKNALAELVESKTNGEYKLVVEKSDINLRSLEFNLENLQIEKVAKNELTKGIRSVHIPSINANFGSLKSFFNIGQVTIEELHIAEPSIEIDAKGEDRPTQINIAQTLLKIFPAVESVLERFNVQSLRISRGNIKIEKDRSKFLHLKLIDFLVLEWDMRQLTSDSRIQLNIHGQQVDLNKSSFSFSEVEYKYPEHYLIFKDFSFESADSITLSRIVVKGKSVLINQLDYDELYFNQRFKLHKIEILEPHFTGRLTTKITRQKGREHYEYPVVDMLKQTFGEVELDSALIKDAQLDLMLAINNDSVKSTLARVDIALNSFKILTDSSRLQVGGININLQETEIKLNDDVKLSCNNISMGANRNFTITGASISTIKTGKEFVRCEKIIMQNFQVLNFIFDRRILANKIELENANVTIAPEYLKLFPNPKDGFSRKVLTDIKNVTLRNANVNYFNNDEKVYLKGLDAEVNNIKEFLGKINPRQVSTLKLNSINATLKNSRLHVRTGRVDLNGRYADIQKLDFNLDKLRLTIDHLHAIPALQQDSPEMNFHHWDKVEAGTLIAKGEIPQGKESLDSVFITLNQFHIRSFTSDITHKEHKLSFQSKRFSGKGITFGGDKEFYFEELIGKVYEFKSEKGQFETRIDSLILDTKGTTEIHHVKHQGKSLSASIPYLEVDNVDGRTDSKSIERIYASNIHINRFHEDSLAHVDSLLAFGFQLRSNLKPIINEIEIFNPVISLGQQKLNESSPNRQVNETNSFDFIKKFKIHNGHISLKHIDITLQGNLTGLLDSGNNRLTGDGLQWKSNKSTVTISRLDVIKDDVSVEQIKIDPNLLYYDSIKEQTDVISGELRNIKFKNISPDSVLYSKKIYADSIYVDDFSLHLKRDKRLPDPPPLEKPTTLDALLHKGKIFTEGIVIKNGNLTYEEVSAKTGGTGKIELNGVQATIRKNKDIDSDPLSLQASAKLYNKAPVVVQYNTIDSTSFNLSVKVEPFDLTLLNQVVTPFQSMEIKSGRLENYELLISADNQFAEGNATMTYKNLHLEVFKKNEPEKKSVGSELLTLFADGVILKHHKENATAMVKQPHIPEKSIFNYWVKSVIQGSLNVIRHGKKSQ